MESESVQQFQQKEKKEWGTPKLIILIKTKPEEGVLSACKREPASGPGGAAWYCSEPCAGCFVNTTS